MSAERTCQCGRGYLLASPYDYSCPDCFAAECVAAVRVVEWIGGVAPPGAMAIEHTPLTDSWERARRFLVEHGPAIFYGAYRDGSRPVFLSCMVTPYRQPWTLRIHESLFTPDDWHATHDRRDLEQARGWWWLDTELAWIADPTEINCTETECCLAQNND